MDTETANVILVISATITHVWIIYTTYFWVNECMC